MSVVIERHVNEPKEILLNHLWVKLSLFYHQLLLSFLIQNVKSRGAAKAAPSQSMLESDPATVIDEVRESFPLNIDIYMRSIRSSGQQSNASPLGLAKDL